MSIDQARSAPRLVILGPATMRGRVLDVAGEHLVIGRDLGCDVVLDDPYVSRRHAALWRVGEQMFVQDLGSGSGTTVNDKRVADGLIALKDDDVIAFADVVTRYTESGQQRSDLSDPMVTSVLPKVNFDVENQRADNINNVGRDQYQTHVQQIHEARQSFLRDVAATRTKARILVWVGFLLFIGGAGVYGAVVLRFVSQVQDANADSSDQDFQLLGPKVGGTPLGVIGFAGAALGAVLLIVGIVLHIVASARRKRVDRDIPLPPMSYWPSQ